MADSSAIIMENGQLARDLTSQFITICSEQVRKLRGIYNGLILLIVGLVLCLGVLVWSSAGPIRHRLLLSFVALIVCGTALSYFWQSVQRSIDDIRNTAQQTFIANRGASSARLLDEKSNNANMLQAAALRSAIQ